MINKLKIILLITNSMTVMAGAIIAPALPDIGKFFSEAAPVNIKLILTIPALTIAISAPLIGFLSDQIGRKKILLVSLLVYGLAGSSGYITDSLTGLLISRAFLGISMAGIMNSVDALIGDNFQGQERRNFVGLQGSLMALFAMTFLMLGGLLADINWRFPFGLYLFSIFILPFVLFMIKESNHFPQSKPAFSPSQNMEKATIAFIYALAFLSMIGFYLIPTQIPFLLEEQYQTSNTLKGLAISACTLTGALASISYPKIKKHLSFLNLFVASFLLMGTGFFLVAIAENYSNVLLGILVVGLGLGTLIPNCTLWVVGLTSINTRGKLIGGLASSLFLGQFVSPLTVALILPYSTLKDIFLMYAVAIILLSLLLPLSKHRWTYQASI